MPLVLVRKNSLSLPFCWTWSFGRLLPVWRNHRDALNRLRVRQEYWVYWSVTPR